MLITEKQLNANRRNAQQSTGPKTQEGKAAVRLNALRYGLRARSILLPGENPEEYHQLCADLESGWQPQNRTEQLLVEQMAVAQWKLARLEVGERSIFAQTMPAEKQMALLDRFSTQRSRLERFLQGRARSGALPEDPPGPASPARPARPCPPAVCAPTPLET